MQTKWKIHTSKHLTRCSQSWSSSFQTISYFAERIQILKLQKCIFSSISLETCRQFKMFRRSQNHFCLTFYHSNLWRLTAQKFLIVENPIQLKDCWLPNVPPNVDHTVKFNRTSNKCNGQVELLSKFLLCRYNWAFHCKCDVCAGRVQCVCHL